MVFKTDYRISRPIISGLVLILLLALAGMKYERSLASASQATRVEIDVLPGEASKLIDATARSTVPVAILSSVDFDATTVNPASVRLAGAPITKGERAQLGRGILSDVNGDGRIDLIVYVSVYSLHLVAGASDALLTAVTFDGKTVSGSQAVSFNPPVIQEQRPPKTAAPSSGTFSNPDAITIADAAQQPPDPPTPGNALPYPSTISVAGQGAVTNLTVTITNYSHTFPDDVDILLVGPTGATCLLMSDCGGDNVITSINLTLDDSAPSSLPDNSPTNPMSTGTYRPTRGTPTVGSCAMPVGSDYCVPSNFPSSAPSGPYGTTLSVFNGTNPNGTWKLYVIDDSPGDIGDITSGWTLSFTAASPSINAISPAVPVRSSTDQSVVVTGSGFQQNLTVTVTFPSGASTTLGGAQIQNVTSNSFTMLATLNASGSWSLRVNNPDGAQSNTLNFTVGSGSLISAISPPSPVASGSNQNIPVSGIGFQPNLSVSVTFPNGSGTTLSGPGQIQNVTPTSFTMVVTLNATGTWRIRVNNPSGGGQSNLYSFTVRAPAPTITNISPDPVTAGQPTTLIVTGSNFQSGFSASVTTPDGAFDIANSGLSFVGTSEVRAQVTMFGMPTYAATLRISNPNELSATKTFQVAGAPATGPLAGTIAIWDGQQQKQYKFRTANLPGSGVTLQVYARRSSNPIPFCNPFYNLNCAVVCPTCSDGLCIPATVTDSQYFFASNSFLPNTDYDIYVDLTYNDVISPGISGVSLCISTNSLRNTRLVKRAYRASTSSSQLLNFDFKPPLVMVHGLGNCFKKWHNDTNDNPNVCEYTGNDSSYWESYARSLGFITFTPSYDWVIDTNNDWEARASYVATQIANNLVLLTGSADYPPWIYIGHSMGGLIGRVLTNKTDDSIRPLARKLRKMYELGTPNSGSWFTRVLGNSVVEYLSPPYVRKTFNIRYDGFGSFSNGLVKAYAGNQCGIFGDCVVDESSVSNIIARFEIPLFPDYETTLLTLPTESLNFNHLELGSSESRDCILNNGILSEVCQLPGGRNPSATVGPCPIAAATCIPLRPGGTDKTQTNGGSSTLAAAITSRAVLLAGDQTTTIPVTVSSTDSILANGFIASGSASFSLINPSGQVIDFSSLPPGAGMHISGDSSESFLLSNPVPGSWSLRATAGSSGASIAMIAAENSPLGFQGFADQSIFNGQTAHLTGKWLGTSTGIASPLMTAQVVDPAGAPIATVNLLDDGNHGDGVAGDGIFGGETPPLSTSGGYSIVFTAQGSLDGAAFERWAEAVVDVVSSTHSFTGSFNDAAIDADLNGIYDTIRETVEISVASAGGYLLSADLYDAQGYFISRATGYTLANAGGVHSANLDFNMSGATCGQFGSAFTVKNLTLSNAGLLTVLDVYAQNVTTLAYDGSLFGCVSGTPSPSISSVQPNSMFRGGSGQVVIGGNSFQNGAQVSLGAGVSVSSVTFGSSSVIVAQVNVAAGATAGPRDVTVTNADGHSSTAAALFTVASDQAPSVSINNLANQQIINGTVTVSATASDDVGIQRVEFYVDGVLSGTDTTFPYQYLWNTGDYSNGPHTFAAKAYDTVNQNSTAQVTVVVSCISAFAPDHQSFAASGGNGEITITSGCNWASTSDALWITITSGSGIGNGMVTYSVAENTASTIRNGTITVAGQTFTVYQGISFLDVPASDPFYKDIGKLAARGVTLGCGSGNYCPNDPVTREQMAAFIMRAKGEFDPPTPPSQRFNDVPPQNVFYNFIDRLAVLQITLGCTPDHLMYCPSDPVKREQMAAFLLRGVGEFSPPTPGSQRFGDVPPANVFYNFIDRLAVLQITLGCTPDHLMYCPNDSVTRAQMAAFLVRAFNL